MAVDIEALLGQLLGPPPRSSEVSREHKPIGWGI